MGKPLTAASIKNAKATGKNDVWLTHYEPVRRHGRLALRVTPGGTKTFYYRYTDLAGKRVALPIGAYHEKGDGLKCFTLAQALGAFAKLVEQYREHKDVRGAIEEHQRKAEQRRLAEKAEAERAARMAQTQTFRQLLEAYIAHLERAGKQSAGNVRSAFQKHVFEPWQDLCAKRAADIEPEELREVIARMVRAGIGRHADKTRSFLRAAFGLALRRSFDPTIDLANDFGLKTNPAAVLVRLKQFDRRGDRNLSESELRAFWHELEGESSAVRDAIRLNLLLGGQRFMQLVRARPQDVDLKARTLRLFDGKGARMQPREHVLPLSNKAAELLQAALAVNAQAPYVLSTDSKRPIHSSTFSHAVKAVSDRMVEKQTATAPFSARDLRRTCETMLAALGVNKDTRAQLLSHGLGGVQAAHYDRHDYAAEKLAGLDVWQRSLLRIVEGRRRPSRSAAR